MTAGERRGPGEPRCADCALAAEVAVALGLVPHHVRTATVSLTSEHEVAVALCAEHAHLREQRRGEWLELDGHGRSES